MCKIINYIYLSILFFLSSCHFGYEGGGKTMKVANKTNSYIIVEFSEDSVPPNNMGEVEFFRKTAIAPGDTNEFHGGSSGEYYWINMIARGLNNRMNIFIYCGDTLKKYMDMEQIRNKRLWIEKMSISQAELDSMNWVIVYNGKNK